MGESAGEEIRCFDALEHDVCKQTEGAPPAKARAWRWTGKAEAGEMIKARGQTALTSALGQRSRLIGGDLHRLVRVPLSALAAG